MSVLRNSSGLAVFVSAALLGTACSSSTGPATAAISSAQADTVSQVVANDAQQEVDFSSIGGTGYVPGAAPAAASCVTHSPATPTNSDLDQVPDSVLITFNHCIINYPPGGSDTLYGAIAVTDPTPAVTDHAWKHNFVALTRVHVAPAGRAWSWLVNGTRQGNGDSASITFQSTNFTTVFTWPSGQSATHVRSWNLGFTADTAGQIRFDSPLPSGSLTISGNSQWTRGTNIWTVTASTPSPLHLNATCTTTPRFDSGIIKAVVTRNSLTNNVMIQFTGCGTYTVTRS